jgi:hypothetical protein
LKGLDFAPAGGLIAGAGGKSAGLEVFMNDDGKSAPEPPPWQRGGLRPPPSEPPENDNPINHFLGGTPGAVFLRLLFVSLIVGAFMMWLDIRPRDIFDGIAQAVRHIWGMGFEAIREIIDYILVGAAIVIPVWLVLRLLTMRGSR